MTNGCDTIPREFAVMLELECEGMTAMQKAQARRIAGITLQFAREQYYRVGLALKNSEPDIVGGAPTVRG